MELVVNLYTQDFNVEVVKDEIQIIRVLSPNSDDVIEYVGNKFSKGWASEIKASIYSNNPKCFIAVKDNEIIGFAAYDATAKGFFGPIGINENIRGKSIGKRLLIKCLEAMYHDGYGYAIIGGVSEEVAAFYEKSCNAKRIYEKENIYRRLI